MRDLPAGKLAPSLWNNGPNWWLVELADAAAVRSMEPDLPAIAVLTRASDAVGLAVYGRADAADHHLAVRAYCPADNIPEDPVPAASTPASRRHRAGACLRDGRYNRLQGRDLDRDGRVKGSRCRGEVWIGGQVQAVIRGSVDW